MKIWQRHLLFQLTKTFFFFFCCIFFVYITVDLSIHGVKFFAKSSLSDIAQFYLSTLATLLELFLSLSFLLAILRVLFDLNSHRELLALQMAGLSKKRLLLPFFFFALLLSSLCYINSEWMLPNAQDTTLAFRGAHKKIKPVPLYTISLPDESTLIYQSFNEEKKELFDVFWIRSSREIWHMKYLETIPPQGRFVHRFVQNNSQLEKAESFLVRAFPEIPWDPQLARYIPLENRSISNLLMQARNASERSHLYYKLLTPLMPLLILFVLAPLCMRFARNQPFFLIAACALFSFIALKVILDGMLILGENLVLPASLAILSPPLLLLLFLTPPFLKMR